MRQLDPPNTPYYPAKESRTNPRISLSTGQFMGLMYESPTR